MRLSRSDIADFAYFLVVAKHLNFRKAGLELGISASAVSHALKGLEKRLNIRLFNRTSRSVTLTTAGEELREALERPFEEISNAVEVLNRFRDTPSGHVRLNVPTGAADILLAPILPEFFRRYPNILMEISVTNQMVDVIGQGFDAGIRYGGTVPEDMIAQRLSPDIRWVVAGSPAYFERNSKPEVPQDLMQHHCMQLRVGDDSLYRWEFEKENEKITIAAPGPVIVDDGNLAIKLAVQDVGLVYMNEWDVREHLASGSLVTVLDDWSPLEGGFYIYYSSRMQIPTGVRLLTELIHELRPLE